MPEIIQNILYVVTFLLVLQLVLYLKVIIDMGIFYLMLNLKSIRRFARKIQDKINSDYYKGDDTSR